MVAGIKGVDKGNSIRKVEREKMESLQRLAVTALMALFKDVNVWEDVEEKIMEMEGGWKTWVVEEEMKRAWAKHQTERKKDLFKNVHRQLVSWYCRRLLTHGAE